MCSFAEYKPDTSAILSELGIQVMNSDIILDGGNIISCGDKVIMTDKIIKENPHYDRNTLIDTISSLLEAEIVLIPQDSYEEYGHSDGMVRYMGNGHVLLNNYCDVDKALRKRLLSALQPHFDITELHYGTYTDRSWAYLNFLHVGQHLFIPMTWGCGSLVDDGGALNCSTWNILVDLPKEEESKELPETI